MRIIVTGFSGFVSRYFVGYLQESQIESVVLGIDAVACEHKIDSSSAVKVLFERINLLDIQAVEVVVAKFKPDFILHLASCSSVGFSWENPALCFSNNVNIFLNVMEVVRKVAPGCRVLSVGSSEQYGNYPERMLPLKEDYPSRPLSQYAVARVAQEHLSQVYCDGYGMDMVMTRSFNHIGAGQRDAFAVSSFAKQLVEISKGRVDDRTLVVGDVGIVRDFLDVRDVVRAYYSLLVNGEKGEIYNVCSGVGVSLREVIDTLCRLIGVEVRLTIDQKLIRPNDNMAIIGSNQKIKEAIGWEPRYKLEDSLGGLFEYWAAIFR